jgi:plastocyanin
MRRTLVILAALSAIVALVVAAVGQAAPAANKKIRGNVGPGFVISMSKQRTPAGTYNITITDQSNIHNFHLRGPGVNKRTSVSGTGRTVWRNVVLQKGKVYRFVCDPHASDMRGTLRVT